MMGFPTQFSKLMVAENPRTHANKGTTKTCLFFYSGCAPKVCEGCAAEGAADVAAVLAIDCHADLVDCHAGKTISKST